jgi:hypothetical protein
VLKSQILAGGRGLGRFTNGLQGGVHICTAAKAKELAKQMLGGTLVTKQTGPAGKPVNTLYVARKMQLKREMYFAILLDRKTAGPVMIGCRWGRVWGGHAGEGGVRGGRERRHGGLHVVGWQVGFVERGGRGRLDPGRADSSSGRR